MNKRLAHIMLIAIWGIIGGYPINDSQKIRKRGNFEAKQYMRQESQEISTKFSSEETLVLQLLTDMKIARTTVDGREAYNTAAFVFMPDGSGGTISCPLNYFQVSVSLPEKWILNDSEQKTLINRSDNFKRIIVTQKARGVETVIGLPNTYSERLFDYFMLDISHNENRYKGFDCYAFASSIANVKYYPASPDFDYREGVPAVGDVVVLSNGRNLPGSIKHWAIFLGNDQYLSKFGKAGGGTSSLVTVMGLDGMKLLYESSLTFIAAPKANAKVWAGYTP